MHQEGCGTPARLPWDFPQTASRLCATRIVFIINFIFALLIAHRSHSFQQMFPALVMIAAGLFFLFNGAGRLSIDALLERPRGSADRR